MECLEKRLSVMDSTAFSLCMDNRMPILVFNLQENQSIRQAVCGEQIGTNCPLADIPLSIPNENTMETEPVFKN